MKQFNDQFIKRNPVVGSIFTCIIIEVKYKKHEKSSRNQNKLYINQWDKYGTYINTLKLIYLER